MSRQSSLRKLLTAEAIAKLVDEKTLARGADYFERGAVTLVDVLPGEVVAEVLGMDSYDVRLYADAKGRLGYECSCPMGHDGVFCKHLVATALAWFGQGEIVAADSAVRGQEQPTAKKPRAKGRPHTQAEVIQSFLQGKDEHELRALLLEASQQSKPLRDKLLLMARTSGGADLASLKDAVRHATRTSGFMGGHESARYARQLEDLAEMLSARIPDGDKGLVEVIELAIKKAERALLHIDDSNGYVMPAILGLQRVHLKACTALRPDPLKLALRLFAYQQEGEWDVFHAVLPQYLDALGPLGLQRYEQFLRERWEPLPTLTAADAGAPWDTKRFRVEAAMEAFARTTGEVSFIAHVLKKNLSSPMRYLMLAQLYFEHDMPDDALHFGMEGLDAFKHEHRTKELAAMAVALQLNAGDKDAAQAVAWAQFAARPGAAAFYELIAVAEQLGRRRELEKQALWKFEELMRAAEAAPESPNIWQAGPRSELLAIAIREGQSGRAWELYAGGKTAVQLWQPLAELRAKTHPQDALALYRKLLPMRVQEGAPKARYDAAFEVVKAMREVYAGLDQLHKFQEQLAGWKVAWGNKRNFMKLLDSLSRPQT
ncbi:SWIM zinc finger domain-containing protein [Thiomonas sp. FB-6]|uniref:SWIM zinc finger family protein n=1 Tax=Thiomonas sp. FB-6 TaxID=1158291 RepID=UPI0003A21F31|nr:DUF6880 family protein [Thiomonas sp. FB-6]